MCKEKLAPIKEVISGLCEGNFLNNYFIKAAWNFEIGSASVKCLLHLYHFLSFDRETEESDKKANPGSNSDSGLQRTG